MLCYRTVFLWADMSLSVVVFDRYLTAGLASEMQIEMHSPSQVENSTTQKTVCGLSNTVIKTVSDYMPQSKCRKA